MSTVPVELEEAARIDGCSVFKTYFTVVMPLLKPAMATLIIMEAFQIWNDYLLASLYVSKKQLKTLTVAIQSLFSGPVQRLYHRHGGHCDFRAAHCHSVHVPAEIFYQGHDGRRGERIRKAISGGICGDEKRDCPACAGRYDRLL